MSQQIKHLDNPINFDTWTERASSAGKLNTNPAGKSPKEKYEDAKEKIKGFEEDAKVKALTPAKQRDLDALKAALPELEKHQNDIILSQTAKTHLKEVYWANRTGIMRNIHSKYMENGKMAEPDAIALISELDDPDLFEMGSTVYTKCDLPRQRNEHFEGECDIRDFNTKSIQDIKCSWDISTYYPHIDELIFSKDSDGKTKWSWDEVGNCWRLPENNIENDIYECQGIVYMELYGMSEFWLRYCLVDMPLDLLEQQFRWIAKDFGGKTESEAYLQACSEFSSQHRFGHLPIQLRVCTFKIKRNNEKYLDLCRRVEKAREYLNWYSNEMFLFENPQKREKVVKLITEKIFVIKSEKEKSLEKELENVVEFNGCTKEEVLELLKSRDGLGGESYKPDFVPEFPKLKNEIDISNLEIKDEHIVKSEEKIINEIFEGSYNSSYIPLVDTYIDNSKEGLGLEKPDEYIAAKDEYVAEENTTLDKPFEYVNEDSSTQESEDIEMPVKERVVSEIITQNENGNIIIDVTTLKNPNYVKPEEKSFPLNLDEIQKEETDEFSDKIQALKTIEDAVEFYMENSSQIDDTKYEQLFYAKKEALSNLLDAPKIKKAPKEEKISVSSPVQSNEKPIAKNVKLEPEIKYDGTETYTISDGFKDISEPLSFELAKESLLHFIKSKFPEWDDYKKHRDGIMVVYAANKILIERDKSFKEVVSNLSKEECARLVEIKRKAMLDMVNKM